MKLKYGRNIAENERQINLFRQREESNFFLQNITTMALIRGLPIK